MKYVHAWEEREMNHLMRAILTLKSTREAKRFFRDLCTREELIEMAKRWQAAGLIDKGVPYREVSRKTGLSTTTVTRVADWLYGGKGGYQLMLKRVA